MKYTIEITEILQKQVEVEADSKEQALQKVEDDYECCQIIVTAENYKDTTFKILYDLKGSKYTIDQLREGYREVTGLDNDKSLSDELIYNYMLELAKEE